MPGGIVCSVATCKSNSKKAKENLEHIMFFTFPKELKIRREWIKKCYRKDKFNPKYKRICSRHFKPNDFEDELQARLTGSQLKKLKKDAIPSLNLLLPECEESVIESTRVQRYKKKERQVLIEKILQEENIEKSESVEQILPAQINPELVECVEESIGDKLTVPCCSKESVLTIKEELETLRHENEILKTKNMQLESSFKKELEILQQEKQTLQRKLEIDKEEKDLLKQDISNLEKRVKEKEIKFEEKVKLMFKDSLTPNQVDIMLQKKSKARWTADELSKAFTLRYFSKRCYIYLRQTLHYPLPGLSTLQQWAVNINLRSGYLEDVLKIMNTVGKEKSEIQRTTILSFDEMKVASLYEFDQKDDEIVGLYSNMQVIMARGLFDKWKQPVFIDFNQKVTKNILETVIIKLHQNNYNVVACTSDCGGSNQGLWKELGISVHNTSMKHPVTNNAIYFFADVPHLLKLLRNWFLDTGFSLSNGDILNKNPVKALMQMATTEISSCYKLTKLHLNCEKTQRQNVKLAAQLFSNTTATALKHYLPGEDKNCSKKLGEFFQLVNSWFDTMNSYTPTINIPTKKPYGLNIDFQNEILNDMLIMISDMKCVGKTTMQIFQKGIIMSIKSIIDLFEDLKSKLNITYILTHRLNQDCLENLFSQLRTRGGLHDHPSPLNALYRMRMILLGKNPGIVQTNSNVQTSPELEHEEYLLVSALQQAHIETVQLPEPQNIVNIAQSESSASSGSTIISSEKDASEKDGLIYIAGYLAKRHLTKYPHLGQFTYKTDEATSLHSYNMPSWLQRLSYGGLVQPSNKWVEQVNTMESYFQKFHKNKFKRGKGIIARTGKYIKKYVNDIPPELVKEFCRQRIFIRIKFMNLKKEETKFRKRKISSGSSSIAKKIQKFVT